MIARGRTLRLPTARSAALVIGVASLLALCLPAFFDLRRPLLAYLVGYVFWSDVAIGLLGLLMLQHLMRSEWGRSLRPVLDAAAGTFPLLAVLFLPIVAGVGQIYDWRGDHAASAGAAEHMARYFNAPWFALRAVGYFALWTVLGVLLRRAPPAPRARLLSAWGLGLSLLAATFAAIDWVRSLSPHWHSTTFGLYFVAGQGLSAFAFAALFAVWLAARVPRFAAEFTPARLHDLSKLTLTFVVLWAYIAFTQFLIIWAGNIPRESAWYVARTQHGWAVLGAALIALHFAVPFLLLLPRYTNTRARWAASIAAALLVMRFVDVYWLVVPARDASPWPPRWLAPLAALGIGGVWLSALLGRLQAYALAAVPDTTPVEETRP
jgi:hypothetical protein